MKLLKAAFVVLIHMAFVLKPQELSQSACGFDGSFITYYKFLDPEIISQPKNKPFHFTFERLYDFTWDSEKGRTQDNLKEWRSYFKSRPSTQDIKQVVYKATATKAQQIKFFVQGTNNTLSASWRNNSLVKYLKSQKATHVISYLLFAKKCEPYVIGDDDMEKSYNEVEIKAVQNLIINGTGAYQRERDAFIKMRYAYQLVRLAHYSRRYQQAISLYDNFVQPLANSSQSLIKYWALAHKAGALMRSGKKAEGAYLFARVFDYCPSRKVQAFYSFKVISNQDFQRLVKLCKNNKELATVYLLRGLKPYANALEEIQKLYKIAPTSDYLSLLLAREINKMEVNLLAADLSNNLAFYQKFEGFPKAEAIKYLKQLQLLVKKVLQENKVKNRKLWEIANGYLAYVGGKPVEALRLLNNISANNATIKRQLYIFKLAIQIVQLKKITYREETSLFQQVKTLKHAHLMDYLKNVFHRKLYAQGDIGKAYLCSPEDNSLPIPLTMKVVDNLIAWEKSTKNKTPFEKALNSKLSNWYNVKATMYFNEDKLKDALKYYKLSGNAKKLKANPKFYTISGSYGHRRPVISQYTHISLIEEILRLQAQAKAGNALASFDLGNIYYNMTWFGNTWDALEDYRSSSSDWFFRYELDQKKGQMKTPRMYDMSYPLKYFTQTISLAHTKRAKELATKATYMAAKCQRMAYIVSKDYDEKKTTPSQYLTYFKLLEQQYSSTQYHKEIIKECMYYNNFLQR